MCQSYAGTRQHANTPTRHGTALERIQGYIDIEHEKAPTEGGRPPAYWPASGDLRVENLSARYSQDGPKVLHDISFYVKSGDSLTLSLLRCIPTEGSVTCNGLETSALNLDVLRSSTTMIPQVPELLSGSLRVNLDPFGQYDDVELNYALRAAGLFALQSETDGDRITLDSAISVGRSNLSIGQRQIFALARAIVRKSKILILDEGPSVCAPYALSHSVETATSAIGELPSPCINSALYCNVLMHPVQLVLDAGCIVEFDSPKELLKIKDGKLRALVDESGDPEILYAMAGAN
ncbi:P-loop containing nucleoside triphosphate hydrolase protein [Mycena galopus ATCC 62051]|nr:P-loop containing nucleoside triphosphate hydrolase protein [Mycena galopus ATCC 62051]